ncbi:hypothetical protein LEP1GSC058_3994 [Leptospira fainei serovar Hurstbridge str. BUT 6]|uniref:Outer membrane protein beta-barrel domain protein n=1 Tax=Leptospira fainei serovar Hurstbridge str. BUT 6 TaxID=1193011 RepID=S3W0Z4_9LEPT|nr:hypothetical protein [Leptospira fainei]EPG73977.1 hypothetical protein LEP1GSC058_3994 [Leptospira fainei serovar Hurstbridge str. BUT 6]
MRTSISILFICVYLLLFFSLNDSILAQNKTESSAQLSSSNGDFSPVPGEEEQSQRRANRKFFIGGLGANGFHWLVIGHQLSQRFALNLLWQEQRTVQRFDLHLSGVQPDLSGQFTLTNHEKKQRQIGLQFEWFPFANPYFFAVGIGLETFTEKQRKTLTWVPIGATQEHDWNVLQKKGFISGGAGFRYFFSSGFFIHFGGNLLLYLNKSYQAHRGAYVANTYWDPRQFQQDWMEPDKIGRDRQSGYGAQVQIMLGFAF